MISVIIPTYARSLFLGRLLDSLPAGVEKVIIDDSNGLLSLAKKRNCGARQSHGEYILFIDDDNYVGAGALEKLLLACGENVGIVGMMACYDDDTSTVCDGGSRRHYLSGFTQGINTNRCWFDVLGKPYEVDEVANSFMVRRDVFEKLGGLDEARFPIDLDEADLCIRAKRAGYKVMIAPEAVCYHHSLTYSFVPNFRRPMNAYFMGRNRILFQRKHLSGRDFLIYLAVFMPVFVLSYCVCLLLRGKPGLMYYFLRGVKDGLQGRLKNQY